MAPVSEDALFLRPGQRYRQKLGGDEQRNITIVGISITGNLSIRIDDPADWPSRSDNLHGIGIADATEMVRQELWEPLDSETP